MRAAAFSEVNGPVVIAIQSSDLYARQPDAERTASFQYRRQGPDRNQRVDHRARKRDHDSASRAAAGDPARGRAAARIVANDERQ